MKQPDIQPRNISLKNQRININSQDKTHTITAKVKEQNRNLFNTVTTEHRAQTTQSIKRSEQNKQKRVKNITSTRMGKARRTGSRDHRSIICWMWIKRT